MEFERDPTKAAANFEKHGVFFEEASTVRGDPLAETTIDRRDFGGEVRFATVGQAASGPVLVVAHVDRNERVRIISARTATRRKGESMSQPRTVVADDEMLPEYDFRGGVRGKYYERYRQGSNVVLLEPDVREGLPSAEAVNRALRLLLALARKASAPAKRTPRGKQRANPVAASADADPPPLRPMSSG